MFGRSKCGQLLDFDEARKGAGVHAQTPRGIRTIPVAGITGTVGRCCDIDRCFNALRPHLRRALATVRRVFPDGAVTPIDVIKLGEAYFVSDGHNRVAAARAAGSDFVDAEVTELFR